MGASLLLSSLAFVFVTAGPDNDWRPYRVNEVDLSFAMPSKPTGNKSMMNGAQSMFYTSDSAFGRFVAGYTPFPAPAQGAMKKAIVSDPGSPGVKGLMQATVAAFAKGGKAKVKQSVFGMDRGLPAEFATVSNDQITLNIRVYLSSKCVYMFVASGDDASSLKFFNSVKVPGEIGKTK